MSVDSKRVQAIFLATAGEPSTEQRAALLVRECQGDTELRRRVEALLQAHDQPQSFLDEPAVQLPPTSADEASVVGSQIGPYKLLQQIGEGGMGVVYRAQQTEPVQRDVALKVIKPGMDSRQVIARFEAERQALALMEHPHIAKVLDAGTTDSGRPYFVMELVKGQPITHYCDEKHLTPRQRLELLVPVCQAIQHAHQKGIIHRDIKPTNILVAEYDEQPVPKVIDFGVAKAIGSALTEKTMFTGLGQIVGTLEYMSPEQAKVNQLDIDTRSDIYSLGVLLYELLTGSTPFHKERLRSAAFDEILRIIREEEPQKPSTRLSESKDSLPSISAQRQTEPARLTKLVRGELDWIVMKALEKDRSRRYETAASFAADLQRYLSDEPVLACPPSARYKLRKFARRYKKAVVTSAAFVLLLMLGVVASTWQAVRATRAQREAQQAETKAKIEAANYLAVTNFVQADLLGQADFEAQTEPGLAPDRDVKVLTLLDRAAANVEQRFKRQPLLEAAIRLTIGNAYRSLGAYPKARPQLERALEIRRRELGAEHSDTLAARNSLLRLHLASPKLNKNLEQDLRDAVELGQRVLGAEDAITLTARHQLALWYSANRKYDQVEPLLDETLATRRRVLGADHLETLRTQHNLGLLYAERRQYAKAEELYAKTLESCRRVLGPEHPLTLSCMNGLGAAHFLQGQYAKAEPLLAEALEDSRRVMGPGNGTTQFLLKNLAEVYLKQGQYAKAEPLLVESLNIHRGLLNDERRGPTLWAQVDLSELYAARHRLVLLDQKKYVEAEPILRDFLTIHITRHPWLTSQTRSLLGECLAGQQKYAEAEPLLLTGYAGLEAGEAMIPIADRQLLAEALVRIVQLYEAWNRPGEAAEWQQKLDRERERQPRREEALVQYERGLAFLKEGKRDEAQAAFGEAVRLEPSYPEAHYRLGLGWAQKRKPVQAEALFAEASRLKPHYSEAQYCLGWALQAQGKAAEAEVAYEASRRGTGLSQASFEAVRAGLAWALEKQKKWDEAANVYRQIVKFKPTAGAYRGLGSTLQAQGKLDEAIAEFRKAIEVDPKYAVAYGHLAGALQAQGKLDEAATNYRKASELNPKDTDSLVALGTLLLSQKKNDEAIAVFRQALLVDPENASVRSRLSSALRDIGKLDEAAAMDRQATEHDPQDAKALIALGTTLRRQKKLDEAIAKFRKAVLADPAYIPAYMSLASTLLEHHQPDEAITMYQKAIELNPKFGFAHDGLGQALIAQNKVDEALAAFRRALEVSPELAYPHLNIGRGLLRKQKLAEAIAEYEEFIRRTPRQAPYLNEFAWLLATCTDSKLQDGPRAVQLAQKAVDLAPTNGAFGKTLGMAHYRAGDWKAAIETLNKSMALRMGGDGFDWFFLAMAHWQLGEKEPARKWYEQAVDWTDRNQPRNDLLRRLRAEAEELKMQNEKAMSES